MASNPGIIAFGNVRCFNMLSSARQRWDLTAAGAAVVLRMNKVLFGSLTGDFFSFSFTLLLFFFSFSFLYNIQTF